MLDHLESLSPNWNKISWTSAKSLPFQNGFLLKIDHHQHFYQPVMNALNLCSPEDRCLRSQIVLKLIQYKIDAQLLERVSLRVPTTHTWSLETLVTSQLSFNLYLLNDPFVRTMLSLNDNNVDIWPYISVIWMCFVHF